MKFLIIMLICLFASLEFSTAYKLNRQENNAVITPLTNCTIGQQSILNLDGSSRCVKIPKKYYEKCVSEDICQNGLQCKSISNEKFKRCVNIPKNLNERINPGEVCNLGLRSAYSTKDQFNVCKNRKNISQECGIDDICEKQQLCQPYLNKSYCEWIPDDSPSGGKTGRNH